MAERKRRLGLSHKRLCAQVAREAWAKANGNREAFEAAVKGDSRVAAIDPALIILFVRLAMAIFDYFKNRNAATGEGDDSDDGLVLAAVRYMK